MHTPSPVKTFATLLVTSLLAATTAQAQLDGLRADFSPRQDGPQWLTRLEMPLAPMAATRVHTPLWLLQPAERQFGFMSDYQFDTFRLGETGGLRLTGGVLINLRPSNQLGALPTSGSQWLLSGSGFAGVGYASGSADGLWGFSADVGLTGLDFGDGAPAATDPWRLGLSPLVRLGMRLSF
jgi:hypothetical protein